MHAVTAVEPLIIDNGQWTLGIIIKKICVKDIPFLYSIPPRKNKPLYQLTEKFYFNKKNSCIDIGVIFSVYDRYL